MSPDPKRWVRSVATVITPTSTLAASTKGSPPGSGRILARQHGAVAARARLDPCLPLAFREPPPRRPTARLNSHGRPRAAGAKPRASTVLELDPDRGAPLRRRSLAASLDRPPRLASAWPWRRAAAHRLESARSSAPSSSDQSRRRGATPAARLSSWPRLLARALLFETDLALHPAHVAGAHLSLALFVHWMTDLFLETRPVGTGHGRVGAAHGPRPVADANRGGRRVERDRAHSAVAHQRTHHQLRTLLQPRRERQAGGGRVPSEAREQEIGFRRREPPRRHRRAPRTPDPTFQACSMTRGTSLAAEARLARSPYFRSPWIGQPSSARCTRI